MSKKAVLTTFIVAVVLVVIVGALSFLMARNRPSADIVTPPVPPAPNGAPADNPPVPPTLRLKGDANNDGIVNVLDLSVIISNWQQVDAVHNLVDDVNGNINLINALDLSQVITYWGCTELKPGCGYYNSASPTPSPTPSATGTTIVPPPIPTLPAVSATVTSSPASTQELIVKLNEIKDASNLPFAVTYYKKIATNFYIQTTRSNNVVAGIGKYGCTPVAKTFTTGQYTMNYTCGTNLYIITLDPNRSDANQITLLIQSRLGVVSPTPTSTVTVKPTVTATPPCSFYNRILGRY